MNYTYYDTEFDYSNINWDDYDNQKTSHSSSNKENSSKEFLNKSNYGEIVEYEDDIMDADFEFTSVDTEESGTEKDTDIFYPVLPDFDFWESFLSRKLKESESEIIHDYLLENDTNLQIKSLHYNLILNGAFTIPKLTKNNGNCLFESLSYLGYGKSSEIRKNMAALLLSVRTDYNFFPGKNTCPEELFTNCNDVEVVKDKNTGLVYEYDYDSMVVDLYTNHSWARLPMELVLMTISRIYEIHIKIFSNKSEYINTVSVWNSNEQDIDTVYLGHLNEEHYVPVIKINQEIAEDPLLMDEFMKCYPKYISAKKNYHKWGKQMAISMGLYGNNQTFNNTTFTQTSTIMSNPEIRFDLEQIQDFNDFEVIK